MDEGPEHPGEGQGLFSGVRVNPGDLPERYVAPRYPDPGRQRRNVADAERRAADARGCTIGSSHEPKRVLVLGGTGFLGSGIARAYLAAGADVTLLTRRRHVIAPSAGSRVARLVFGRSYDSGELAAVIAGAQHVVHALGSLNPAEAARDPSGGISRSIPMLVRVLEQLRAAPGVGLTYLSSGGAVYGEIDGLAVTESSLCRPMSAYGISKLAAENYVAMYAQRYGVPSRIVRVSNAYGPGQQVGRAQGLIATLVDAAASGRPVQVYGDGAHVRDYVHVDDVASAVVQLSYVEHGPLVVNVGSGVGHSVRDVVRLVEHASGRALTLRFAPGRTFDVSHNVLDIARLQSMIDWAARPLPKGIGETYAAHARLSSDDARARSA